MKDAGAGAVRLFEDFASPLVLGGEVTPKKFLSGKMALGIGDRDPLDSARFFDFQARRLSVARELLPLDRIGPITGAEWALLACVHDLVLVLHPKFRGAFRDRLRRRVAEAIARTLVHIPAPVTLRDCLSRHTLLSRLFTLSRDDVKVSWWTGSQTFEGAAPSPRLLAWPEVRRVQTTTTVCSLRALLEERENVDVSRNIAPRFSDTVRDVLLASPFTYLLQAGRFPDFRWHSDAVAWLSAKPSRRLLLRAMRRDREAPASISAYVSALDPRAPLPAVVAFVVEWAIELRVLSKVEPFANVTEAERATYAPILAAYERALLSLGKGYARAGRSP